MTPDKPYEYDVTGAGLRALYSRISAHILSGIASGKKRYHAVFPPGTDRGRIVGHVMSAARLKTIILTPNTARRTQWQMRRARYADLYDAAASTWARVPGQMISTNPYSCAPVLTLTYKQLGQSRGESEQHAAVKRFATHAVRQGYKLLVLDECTGFPDEWRSDLEAFVNEADAAVIGFSTHALDSGKDGWGAYCQENERMEISPALAAMQGALAPYRHHLFVESVGDSCGDDPVQSAKKIAPAIDIIKREVQTYGEDARIAVYMDMHALTHVCSAGILDGIDIFRAFDTDADLTGMSRVLLTGASIIIPVKKQLETTSAIQRESASHGWDVQFQMRADSEFAEITGTGRDWHSWTYVELVRALHRQGLAQCVLLPTDILTWGIQTLPFNTVVDLGSDPQQWYVHVPEDPSHITIKDADASVNYWDVACVSVDGGADWERIRTKYAGIECVTEEFLIERGFPAVDVRFQHANIQTVAASAEAWNSNHRKRAMERTHWAGIWKKTVCGYMPISTSILVPREDFPAQIQCEAIARQVLERDIRLFEERRAGMKLHHTLWTVTAVAVSLAGFLLYSREFGLYITAVAFAALFGKIAAKWWSVRGARPRRATVSQYEFLSRAAHAVYEAMRNVSDEELPPPEEALHVYAREDGSHRALLRNVPSDVQARFHAVLRQLFDGTGSPEYVLVAEGFYPGKKRLHTLLALRDVSPFYKPEYMVRIPDYFAQTKAHAEVFRASWSALMGKGRVYFATDTIPDVPEFSTEFPITFSSSVCRL